jgi:hypothetical protein
MERSTVETSRRPAMHTTYRGVVKGGAIVLENGSSMFPDGTEVVVTPLPPPYDVAAAVFEVLKNGPIVTRDDMLELERAIESGKRPRAEIEPFPPDGTELM